MKTQRHVNTIRREMTRYSSDYSGAWKSQKVVIFQIPRRWRWERACGRTLFTTSASSTTSPVNNMD